MTEFFVFGGIMFWGLVAVELIVLCSCMNYENGIAATISVLIFGALLQWRGNTDIIHFVAINPWSCLLGVICYFAIGSLWGTWKWWWWNRRRVLDYEDAKIAWLRLKKITSPNLPPELKEEWKTYVGRDVRLRQLIATPAVKENMANIVRWMTFWPISVLWALIHDFVDHAFREIYRCLQTTLQRIADKWYAGIRADLD